QPPGHAITLLGAQPSQGTCERTDALQCQLGPLAVGAAAHVAVQVHLEKVTRGTLLPHASAPESDGDPFDNTGNVSFTVLNCTILGTFGPDELYGTPGRDHICGRFGNDTIYGGRGSDVIEGGEGADTIYGGRGRDLILA